jgi:uncharacterized protein
MTNEWPEREARILGFLMAHMQGDAAHDLEHIRRVVASAEKLAREEGADLAIVLPAAWLHDCVVVAKDSPLRAQASQLAGRAAAAYLESIGYPVAYIPAIQHAIEAHSFSAGVAPRTREAMVVQDADRLDALGAIGISRCLMLAGSIGRRLYDPAEPFPAGRPIDDRANTIDHFYAKLLRLADTMQTEAGRREARRRTAFMECFLEQLGREI